MLRLMLIRALRAILPIALASLGVSRVSAQEEFKPQFRPNLQVTKTSGEIEIDGDLDDPGWQGAARATGFAEVQPGDQVKPPVESEALVTYDENNFYVALIAHDDPKTVRVSLRDRDQIFSDDYFGVMLDTYGDFAWGYELFVNPIGIQGDLRVVSTGNEDASFDIVWKSRGKVTDTGYQVEIAIPFASLRFPDRQEQTWRINFWRDHQRDVRRRYAWAALNRDDPCWMCQWGTLTGVRGIRSSTNLDVIANVIGYQSGALRSGGDPTSGFNNKDVDGEASVNVRYGLATNSSAEVTLNPDFSQIESDEGQIDVNNTFALFFSERRPFFQEGSDLYDSPISAIYTRSINDPAQAAKLTAQFGRSSMVYLLAHDENSPLLIPLAERSHFLLGERSLSNILRLRRTFLEDSNVGALFTDRRLDGSGAGTVMSLDGTLRFHRNWRLEAQAATSRTEEPQDSSLTSHVGDATFDGGRHTVAYDGETYWGQGVYTSIERSGRVWNADLDYWEYSPTFRTDNGFTVQNDYRQVNLWTGLFYNLNRSLLIDWEPSVGIGRIWNTEGRFEDEWIRPHLYLGLTRQTSVNLEYLTSRERFREIMFPGISVGTLEVDSRFSNVVTSGFRLNGGRTIWRTFSATPVLGRSLNFSTWATFKPVPRLVYQPNFAYSQLRTPDDKTEIFSGYIFRNRLTYQFTRELFLRLVVEYDNFDREVSVEPLFTYRINAFTVFYLGSTGQYQRFEPEDYGREAGDGAEPNWKLSSRQFFAKFQYLIRV